MLSATNAVNLTDGIDGLAASVSAIMITALSILAMKLGNVEISIFGAIVVGSCLGFLMYNFHKAKVMMGDTGSLLLRWGDFKYSNLSTNSYLFTPNSCCSCFRNVICHFTSFVFQKNRKEVI